MERIIPVCGLNGDHLDDARSGVRHMAREPVRTTATMPCRHTVTFLAPFAHRAIQVPVLLKATARTRCGARPSRDGDLVVVDKSRCAAALEDALPCGVILPRPAIGVVRAEIRA